LGSFSPIHDDATPTRSSLAEKLGSFSPFSKGAEANPPSSLAEKLGSFSPFRRKQRPTLQVMGGEIGFVFAISKEAPANRARSSAEKLGSFSRFQRKHRPIAPGHRRRNWVRFHHFEGSTDKDPGHRHRNWVRFHDFRTKPSFARHNARVVRRARRLDSFDRDNRHVPYHR